MSVSLQVTTPMLHLVYNIVMTLYYIQSLAISITPTPRPMAFLGSPSMSAYQACLVTKGARCGLDVMPPIGPSKRELNCHI